MEQENRRRLTRPVLEVVEEHHVCADGLVAGEDLDCLSARRHASVVSRIPTVPNTKISPDGYFVTLVSRAGQRNWLPGRLTRGQVTGYASYQCGPCAGALRIAAAPG